MSASAVTRADRRHQLAGLLLAAMVACAVLAEVLAALTPWLRPGLRLLGALCAWGSAGLLWNGLAVTQRNQCAGLALAGIAALAATWGIAAPVDVAAGAATVRRMLDANLALVAMIAGISFIRLATAAGPGTASRNAPPRGSRALLTTLAGTAALGGAINITAMIMVADRLALRRGSASAPADAAAHIADAPEGLSLRDASWLARAFALAALYSPFIGGMAFALNFAPAASLAVVSSTGLVLAALGVLGMWLAARRRFGASLDDFEGYPLRLEALWLPALLAAAVLGAHELLPAMPVLALIALLAPVVAVLVLVARSGPGRAATQVSVHVRQELPRMAGELWLFLAAGVLATGLGVAFAALDLEVPFDALDALSATVLLALVVALGAAGLHPVIGLSVLVPLLLPLDPRPELLVLLIVSGWSIGCSVCPLAGTNLIVQGRFGHDSRQLVRPAYPYAVAMWAACSAAMAVLVAT